MNQDTNSVSISKKETHVHFNFDEFNISEDSFKPMTKGLGFHQEQKRSSFKQVSKDVKPFGPSRTQVKASNILKSIDSQNSVITSKHVPSGLEAFYGAKGNPRSNDQEKNINVLKKSRFPTSIIG